MSRKGPEFERDIAKKLSVWWTDGKDDSVFWRTQSSGARATQRAKKGKRTDGQYGDLCSTDPCSKPFTDLFTVSLKRGYPEHTLDVLFNRPDNKHGYREFIDEAVMTCREAQSYDWLLIVKPDRRDSLVFCRRQLLAELSPGFMVPCWGLDFTTNANRYRISLMKLDQFLEWVKPKTVLQLHKTWSMTNGNRRSVVKDQASNA